MNRLCNQKRAFLFVVVLLALLGGFTYLSIQIGHLSIGVERIFTALFFKGTQEENLVLWILRMPRTFVAILVGICLSVSGAVMQGVTRNQLATPDMIGITSGASFGTLIAIYLLDIGKGLVIPLPLAATCGGFLTFSIVYTLALRYQLSPAKLILNGIAINSCIGALTLIFSMKLSTDAYNLRSVVLGGSLTYATWDMILMAAAIVLPCLAFVLYKCLHLNLLNLDEEMAIGLGLNLKAERKKLLYITVILSSVSAYIAGGIGFVGMIAPHIAKRLVGPNYKLFLPVSVFLGANLVLAADLISRLLMNQEQYIPIGTLISILGAPYFIYLLFKQDR